MNTFRYFSSVLFFFLYTASYAQEWRVTWEKHFETQKLNYFTDVVDDHNGGFAVLGSAFSDESKSYDLWLMRLNEAGELVWGKKYGSAENDIPVKVALQNDGSFLMVGENREPGKEKILLVKTGNDGNKIWEKYFDEVPWYSAEDMISLDNGDFILVGSKGADEKNGKLWAVRMNEKGDILWEKQFAGEYTGSCQSIKKLPDNGFSVAAKILKPGQKDGDVWVMRANENMDPLWESRVPSPGLNVWPECVCCSPDSCFMVVGWQGTCLNDINADEPIFDYDLQILKLDCKGKVLWTKNFDKEGSEGGNTVSIRPDGNFIIGGVKATSFLGKVGPWLMLVDPSGNLKAETLIPYHFNNDQAVKIMNSSDNGIIVIGPGVQDEASRTKSYGWMIKYAAL